MKNSIFRHLAYFSFLIIFSACSSEDEPGLFISLEQNGDMELIDPVNSEVAAGWEVRANNFNPPNNYTYLRTNNFAFSGEHSVVIKADKIDSADEFWFLRQEVDATEIPPGVSLELKLKVKTVDLKGSGFEVALFGENMFERGTSLYSSSFDMTHSVSGTTDWEKYSLRVPSFPENIDMLEIWLILSPNTTGEVYFDDLKLGFISN